MALTQSPCSTHLWMITHLHLMNNHHFLLKAAADAGLFTYLICEILVHTYIAYVSAFELLEDAIIFTKLDLQNA